MSNLPRRKILFVCTANRDRSRTAEDLYRSDPRFEVRSAGTSELAEQPISEELLRWADRIFVMEEHHRESIEKRYPGLGKPLLVLDIEDRYPRGDAELVSLLQRRLAAHLGD